MKTQETKSEEVKEETEVANKIRRTNFYDDSIANNNLKAAIDMYNKHKGVLLPVSEGKQCSIRSVAQMFNISKSVLDSRITGKYYVINPPSLGRKRELEEEKTKKLLTIS